MSTISAKGRLLIFIHKLLRDNLASVNKINENVIELDEVASNYFIAGQRKKNEYFIGIQEDMLPWFCEQKITEVVIDLNKNYLYLVSRDESKFFINYAIGIKFRNNRLIEIADLDSDGFFSMTVFKIIDNQKMVTTNKDIYFMLKHKISDINEYIENDPATLKFKSDF